MIALAFVVALAGSPPPTPPEPAAQPAAAESADSDAPAAKPADADADAERAAGALAGKMATGQLDTPAPAPSPSPSSQVAPPPPDLPPAQSLGMGELVGQLVKMLLMLGVVVALAYLTLNKGLGKLVERQNAGKRVKVVERVALDQKRSLFLVELDGKQMLLAAGEGGVVHLRDVDASGASASSVAVKPVGFAETLKRAVAGDPPVTTGLAKAAEDKAV